VGVALTLLVNYARFGSPTDFGYNNEGAWTTPLATGLLGTLISPGRGIIWEFPAVLLSILGVMWLWRSRHRVFGILLSLVVIGHLVNVAMWNWWWGGWNFGLRLFVPALPILAVFAACGIKALSAKARNVIPAILLVAGLVWAVPGVLTDLAGGYAQAYDDTAPSFLWSAYPPIGAWPYLDHLTATSSLDRHGIDIVWFRLAQQTGNLSLLPMLGLLALAALLATYVVRSQWGQRSGAKLEEAKRTEGLSLSPRMLLPLTDAAPHDSDFSQSKHG